MKDSSQVLEQLLPHSSHLIEQLKNTGTVDFTTVTYKFMCILFQYFLRAFERQRGQQLPAKNSLYVSTYLAK